MTAPDGDLALLRRYEPVLAYTSGELFFPADVADYVRCCSLRRQVPGEKATELVAAGELTLDRLAEVAEANPDANLHLLFVQRPYSGAQVHRWRRQTRPSIARTGRLAAVGLIARVVDVLFKASLLLRGNVPGGVAAAAAELYQQRLDAPESTYYGRVVREGGYVVLQYWFFYAMNDWRTTFGGVNDHEADWELVTVYLAETADGPVPAWVAVSSHDYGGDDLRRRWDDPDLQREGDHPVVFVGAGSHSGAVVPGDYLFTVNPAVIRPVVRGLQRVSALLLPWVRENTRHGVGIPFLDYTRGDGVRVGPGGERGWKALLVDDDTPWVRRFRGLWGRDTADWLGGERAPAGPRYRRDGQVRASWADPLGWAGLQKVAPDGQADRRELEIRVETLGSRIATADAEIGGKRDDLRQLRATAVSLAHNVSTRALAKTRFAEVAEAERELATVCRERTELTEERAALRAALARPPILEAPQEHLREPHLPYQSSQRRRTRFLHVWATISTPLFLFAVAAVFLIPAVTEIHLPSAILVLAGVILAFMALEAWARRKLLAFATGLLMLFGALAILVSLVALVLIVGRWALLVPLITIAVIILFSNLRDMYRR